MGPFEKTENGNVYIAVFQDYFTKWLIAEPLKDKTAMGVADLFYTKWVTLFGCPMILHSDRGGEFNAEIVHRLCDLLRVKKTFTSPYRPESDGMVESSNRTLQGMLTAFVRKTRDNWDDHLPAVSCAYRSTPHESTGLSPFRMVYGHEFRLPIDLQNDVGLREVLPQCPVAYVEWLRQTMNTGHDLARDKLKMAAARQKKNYQEKCREVSFRAGDWVWRVDSVSKSGKLHPKNLGPYLVVEKAGPVTYRIQAAPEGRVATLHVDKLYRYTPSDEEELKSWLPEMAATREMACQPDAEESRDASCQTDSAVEDSITEEVVCANDIDIPMAAQSPPRASPASPQPLAEDGGDTASSPKDQVM